MDQGRAPGDDVLWCAYDLLWVVRAATLTAARLITAHAALPAELQAEASHASATLRLQVSGSAPLPVSVKQTWEGGIGGGMVLVERCAAL